MITMEYIQLALTFAVLVIVARPHIPFLRGKKGTKESFERSLRAATMALHEAQEWINSDRLSSLYKPIHHDKVQGPTSSNIDRVCSYWVPKDNLEAEPFLVAHYEKDTTCAGEPDTVIPADTYVDLMGRKIPGPKFRSIYDAAPTVMEVSKFKPKNPLRNANLVSAAPANPLSPEEEQKLAEEYELGGHVSDRAAP